MRAISRRFTIDSTESISFIERYIEGRANDAGNKFFLNWQKGRGTKQRIGINKFYGMPKTIAKFLNLPNHERYTGM